jgi:hypothetical protein
MKKTYQLALVFCSTLMGSVSAQSVFEGPFAQGAIGYANVGSTFTQTSTL